RRLRAAQPRRSHGGPQRPEHSAPGYKPAIVGTGRQPCVPGPALLAAQTDDALADRIKKLKDIQQETQLKLGEIIELSEDKAAVSALSETIKNIGEATQSLINASRERLAAAAQHDKQYDALRAAQAAFVAAAGPVMLDAQTRVNAILSSANL